MTRSTKQTASAQRAAANAGTPAQIKAPSRSPARSKPKQAVKRPATKRAPRATATPARTLDARPDTLDFRDRMFEPSLIEVPTERPVQDFLDLKLPVLDQGQEGACTGFGLATVAHYLLTRRKVVPDATPVSPRMLYEMARRYDEWPGEDYSGSSARGAMKGWFKHGLCSETSWPYAAAAAGNHGLNAARTDDAVRRPLGAYLRVNHKDLIAMHCALAEVGVLYATASVHEGWNRVGADGTIEWPSTPTGGHAFAIVAYDHVGFWIQNSWGPDWGRSGLACIGYDDWLANGTDVWVARLGAPVALRLNASSAIAHSAAAGESVGYSFADLRPHLVSLGNNGQLKPGGEFGSTAAEVRQIFREDIPRAMDAWKGDRHLLLYAHGGLVNARSAVQRLADYRSPMLAAQIYPLSFIWHSDLWSTISNALEDAMRLRRPEGALDKAKDFMLDRLDDTLELLVRGLGGKALWNEMKQNALAASEVGSGARLVLEELARLSQRENVKLHVVGHSAGAIFQAPLVRLATQQGAIRSGYLKGQTGYGLPVESCTLWAPACTLDMLEQAYWPAVDAGAIARFALLALNDKTEQDDNVASLYNKSLLYLVSRTLEQSAFGHGTPLAGLERDLRADAASMARFGKKGCEWVIAPNNEPSGSTGASKARTHGAFDDDPDTVTATIARMIGAPASTASAPRSEQRATARRAAAAKTPQPDIALTFHSSSSSLQKRIETIDRKSRAR